jgi:hypothetical protein
MDSWWARMGRRNKPKITKDTLGENIPKPGRNMDHVIPYKTDDWAAIEAIKRGTVDPNMVTFDLQCVGCNVKTKAVQPRALYDPNTKWLCDNCIEDGGFAWASTLTIEKASEYQLVREYPDDSLMRRLSKSPNYKDPLHDPFDPDDNRRIH